MRRDAVTAYAESVMEGKTPACRWAVLACERHLRDLDSGKWEWDQREVQSRLEFFSMLRHQKGPKSGEVFELEPFQQFIVGSVYGWKREDGTRRFRYGYVEIPRKNGKTYLSAGLGIQELMRETGGEVYSVATKEDQAKICWKDGQQMIRHSSDLNALFRLRVKETACTQRESIWRPLGADSDTLDGLNPSCALFDELHAWPNRHLWDVIDDGMGARAQPLIWQITTAGFNKQGICYEHRNHVCSILEGKTGYQDDAYFGIIFTVDDELAWEDEDEWFRANPLLDKGKSLEWMREQCSKSKQMPGKQNTFLNKQLNIWTDAEVRWIPGALWSSNDGAVDEAALAGKRCFAGLDLATNTDIAAFVLYFPETGEVIPRFWIPAENARNRERRDRVPYLNWIREGYVTATAGDVIDYSFIEEEIKRAAAIYDIAEIATDPYGAIQMIQRLTAAGLTIFEHRQGMLSMAPSCSSFERALLGRKIRHGGNPVLQWMAGNVVVDEDAAGCKKPNKAKSREKIDGIVALIMAVGRASLHQETPGSVYKKRGLVTV